MNENTNVFKTTRLQTAIYLSASGALRFIGCKRVSENKIEFWYHDPDSRGQQCELDFESGASVPAIAIFASQRHLRKLMTTTQQNSSTGAYTHDRHNLYATSR